MASRLMCGQPTHLSLIHIYYGELVEAADIDWLDDLTYRPKVNMSDSLTSLKKQAKTFVDLSLIHI